MPQLITISGRILGGTPVISGTRIPVERVRYLIKTGYTIENLREEFPHVHTEKIASVIAYLMGKGLDVIEEEQKTR